MNPEIFLCSTSHRGNLSKRGAPRGVVVKRGGASWVWEWRRRPRRPSVTRRLVPGGGGHATAIESTRGDRGPLTSNRTATAYVSGFRNLVPVRSGPMRAATETCEATSVTGVWTPPRVSRAWGNQAGRGKGGRSQVKRLIETRAGFTPWIAQEMHWTSVAD